MQAKTVIRTVNVMAAGTKGLPLAVAGGSAKEGADLASIVLQIPVRKDFKGDENSMEFQATIVEPLVRAGLSVRAFHSIVELNGTRSIYLEVFASNARLLLEAERVKLRLPLSPAELAEADVRENLRLVNDEGMSFDPAGGDCEHMDLHIPRVPNLFCGCSRGRDPYAELWAPFNPDPTIRHLYQVNATTNFILTEMQALKLLLSIIGARSETENGAGLNLDELRVKNRIKRWFPAHHEAGIKLIYERWGNGRLPWNIPTTAIKDYFSEKIAFYFVFLKHFAKWLILPTLLGLGIFVHQVINKSPGVQYLPLYGVLVAIWSTFFMESWKRRQNKKAQEWGMVNYAKQEQMRPEYTRRAKRVRSYIDGKPTYYSDPTLYRLKRTLSSSVTLTALGAVIVVVGSIFWLRVTLAKESKDNGGAIPNGWPDYITSIINAVQIQIMNFIYTWMARGLTNFENHPTVTAYDNSLTLKLAVFQSINSYFGLIYIAAIKNNIRINGEQQACKLNDLGEPDCMKELQSQLAILMLTRMVMSTMMQFIIPLLRRWAASAFRRCRSRRSAEAFSRLNEIEAAKTLSHLEKEAEYQTYSTFEDYLEIMLQYGYVTLFVVAFPLAPLIALANSMINIYVDSERMIRYSTRPPPLGAQDIGSWHYVFEAMSYASAVTNLTIVMFTNKTDIFGHDFSDGQRLVFFIVAEHVVLLLKYAISTYIPDQTYNTTLQLAREEYLVPKHIFHVKDLVISKDEAAAALMSHREIDEEGNRVDPAAPQPTPNTRNSVMMNPIRGAAYASRYAVKVAPSWFALNNLTDPRKLTAPTDRPVSPYAAVVPTTVTDPQTGAVASGYVVTGALPPHAAGSGV